MTGWLKRLLGGSDAVAKADATESAEPEEAPFAAFQPHNQIERLLMEATVDPDARAAFQDALLQADLYAATPEAPELPGARTVGEGEALSLLNVRAPDGSPVAAIFTAQERIAEVFGPGVGFVAIRGEELLSLVAGQGAWLNPGLPYSVHWTPQQLSAVLGKGQRRTIEKETQVMLGVPAEPPAELVAALQAILGKDDRIAEAWLALAHWPDEERSSWYLDVRTDLDGSVVNDLLAETLRHADYAGRPLDMVVNRPGTSEGAGIRVAPSQTH